MCLVFDDVIHMRYGSSPDDSTETLRMGVGRRGMTLLQVWKTVPIGRESSQNGTTFVVF